MPHYDVRPLDGFPLEYGLLLATLQDGTREWREELGAPSEDAIVWQARPGGHSIGGVLLHIAEVELYWVEQCALNRPLSEADLKTYLAEETKVYQGKWPTPPRQPLAWYLDLLNRARARTLAAVRDFPPPDSPFDWKGRDRMTYRWVLAHVAEHESYHAGQAVLLHDLFRAR